MKPPDYDNEAGRDVEPGRLEGPVPLGTVLSGCRLVEVIGQGGMGFVYKGIDEILQRRVAVKFLHRRLADAHGRKRFLREAASMAQCDHPGIGRIYTCGEFGPHPYFVMEYLEGRTLEACLATARTRSKEPPIRDRTSQASKERNAETARFFLSGMPVAITSIEHVYHVSTLVADLADALHHAHELGIAHRDVKPSNVQICLSGAIKLIDFGLASSIAPETVTGSGELAGTLAYMAPECFDSGGPQSRQALDIYGLGVIFYELATLRHPVTATSVPEAIRQITGGGFADPCGLNRGLSDSIGRIICRCLSRKPSDRYPAAEELADAIRAHIKAPPSTAGEASRAEERPESAGATPIASGSALPGETMTIPAGDVRAMEAASGGASAADPSTEAPSVSAFMDNLRTGDRGALGETSIDRAVEQMLRAAYRDLHLKCQPETAIERLECALELSPDDAEAALLLSRATWWAGDVQGCKARLDLLRGRAESLTDRQRMMIDLYEAGLVEADWKKAYPIAMKYLLLYGWDEYASSVRSGSEQGGQSVEVVIRETEEQLAAHPEHMGLYWRLSSFHQLRGDMEAARAVMERFVASYPDLSIGHVVAAARFMDTEDFEQAAFHARRALEQEPTNLSALFVQATLQVQAGDLRGAIATTRRSIGLCPLNVQRALSYMRLCQLYEELGEAEPAREYLTIARAQAPEYPFMSAEECRRRAAELELGGLYAEILCEQDREVVDTMFRRLCFECTRTEPFHVPARLDYYNLDGDGRMTHAFLTPAFNWGCRALYTSSMLLAYLPVLPFLDESGRIVLAQFETWEARAGRHYATIRFHDPHAPGRFRVLASGYSCDGLVESTERTVRLRTHEAMVPNRKRHVLVIGVPREFEVRSVSPPPEEIVEGAERTICVYRRTLRFQESYPRAELVLSRR